MENLLVSIGPNCELLTVVEEREKSWKVQNQDNGTICWLPKSGLKLRKPGQATYENDFTVKPWFRDRLDRYQERALGIAE